MKKITTYSNNDIFGFFLGSLLGDGCFVKKSQTHNTYVVFKHCEKQLPYLMWKYDFLKQYWMVNENQVIKEATLKGCFPNAQPQFCFKSKSLDYLNYFKITDRSELIKDINDMAIAVWTIDDGSRGNSDWKISCGSANEEEKEIMSQSIYENFGLQNYIYHHPNNPVKDAIRIYGDSQKKLDQIIMSKIPNNILKEIGKIKEVS